MSDALVHAVVAELHAADLERLLRRALAGRPHDWRTEARQLLEDIDNGVLPPLRVHYDVY